MGELIVEEASPVPVNISAPRPQFKYLGQMHIFVLAHILRRPIIVYAESKARDISTEDTIFELPPDERMDGIYLPLLLPREATRSDPLALAFHSSHFAPLVATFPDFKLTSEAFDGFEAYFPIVDVNHVPLPVHYLDASKGENAEEIIKVYLDIAVTPSDIPVAKQFHAEKPEMVIALLERYLEAAEPLMKEQKAKEVTYKAAPCLGGCGFFASVDGFCSTCHKKRNAANQPSANRPHNVVPDIASLVGFQNLVELLQPCSVPQTVPNQTRTYRTMAPKLVVVPPANTTGSNTKQNLCRGMNCPFYGTNEGYCSACYRKYFSK